MLASGERRGERRRGKPRNSSCLSLVARGLVPGKLLRGLSPSLVPATSAGSVPSHHETQGDVCSPAEGNYENSNAEGSRHSGAVPNSVMNWTVKDGPLKS